MVHQRTVASRVVVAACMTTTMMALVVAVVAEPSIVTLASIVVDRDN